MSQKIVGVVDILGVEKAQFEQDPRFKVLETDKGLKAMTREFNVGEEQKINRLITDVEREKGTVYSKTVFIK